MPRAAGTKTTTKKPAAAKKAAPAKKPAAAKTKSTKAASKTTGSRSTASSSSSNNSASTTTRSSAPAKKASCKGGPRVNGKCPKAPCKSGPRVNGKCPKAAAKPRAVKAAAKPRASLRDSIHDLSKPAFLRLAHKAGVVSLQGQVYEDIRGVTKEFLDKLVGTAGILMEYGRRKTLSEQDALQALETLKIKMYGAASTDIKRCATPEGKRVETRIKDIQKQSECVYFARAAFERVIKEILQNFTAEPRLGRGAGVIIQLATEEYIVKVFQDAQRAAMHAQRNHVEPSNIAMSRSISSR